MAYEDEIVRVLGRQRATNQHSDGYEFGFMVNRLFGIYDLINDFLDKDSIVCELGSFQGASSELFALMCKQVYCIDFFDPNVTADFGHPYEVDFDNSVRKYTNVVKIKADTNEAYKQFDDHMFSMCYVDANHDYEQVRKDIINYFPKVKHGGIMAGHDVINEQKNSVMAAVESIFGKNYRRYSDSSWAIRVV
jgi:predicted O-methyltransferase YrrM